MFLESLGNFLSGRGWRSDRERDEEEARRKRQQRQSTPTKVAPRIPGGVNRPAFPQYESNPVIRQNQQKGQPEKSLQQKVLGVDVNQAERLKQIDAELKDPNRGLNPQQIALAERMRKEGRDPQAMIQAARDAHFAQIKARDSNNPWVIARDTAASVPRILTGGTIGGVADMSSRVLETLDQAGTAGVRAIQRAVGVDETELGRLTRADSARFRAYEDFRSGVDEVADTIAGMKMENKKDRDERASRISTGKGTFGDYAWGALDTFDVAGVGAVVNRLARPARQAARSIKQVDSAAKQIAEEVIADRGGTVGEARELANRLREEILRQQREQGARAATNDVPAPTPQPRPSGPATQGAIADLETKIKRPLTPTEQAAVIQGEPPKEVIDTAAEIGDGISTPSTRAAAEQEAISVSRVADAEANPALPATDPAIVPAPEPVRQTLMDKIYGHINDLNQPRPNSVYQRGSIEIPFGREADDLDIGPSAEDLARIEANPKLNTMDDLSPQSLEAQFLREDIAGLRELITRRERAGASENVLRPLYAEIEAKQAELQGVNNPPAPTKAQAAAAAHNKRVLEAQRRLEEIANARPKKAPAKAQKELSDSDYEKAIAAASAPKKTAKEVFAELDSAEAAAKAVDAKVPAKAPAKADVATAKTVSEATGKKVTQKQVDDTMVNSLFEKGGTKTSTKEVAAEIKSRAPAKVATKPVEKAAAATEVVPPKKASAKNKAIQKEKQKAVNTENTAAFTRETVKKLKKVKRAVNKAEGRPVTGPKEAPKLARYIAKTYADDTDLGRTIAGLSNTRQKVTFTNEAVKSMARVSTLSSDELVQSANMADFGLGAKVDPRVKLVYGAEGLVPKLRDLRKAAAGKNPPDLEAIKRYDTAIDNVISQTTSQASEAGSINALLNQVYRNAGPDYQFARAEKHFTGDKVGGTMTEAQKSALKDTYESVYTAEKELDKAREAHSELMARLKDKRTKISDKEIDRVVKQMERRESVLATALADNERVAGEIFEANLKAGTIKDDSVGAFGPAYEGMGKAFMLSAPSGRARDVFSTAAAMTDQIVVDTLAGLFRKGGDISISADLWKKGTKEGWENVKAIKSGDKRGGIYLDSGPDSLNKSRTKSAKTSISAAPRKSNWFVRLVNAASGAPTELGRGYFANRIAQLGGEEGKALGLTGTKLDQYKRLQAASPSDTVKRAAENDFFRASSMHKNFVHDAIDWADGTLRAKAASIKNPAARKAADMAVRVTGMLSMPFKKYASGAIHRLLTDQNPWHNLAGVAFGKKLPGQALNKADRATHAARLVVNSSKLALAGAALLPLMSDEDANGNKYSPPYLHIGDLYIPLASLGPILAAPLGQAYAMKKATEDGGFNPLEYAKTYGTVMFQSTGMDSLLAGDSPIGRLMTGANGNREESADTFFDRTIGRLAQDWATQWVPAGFRDMNSVIDWMIGQAYAPETRIENEDGKKMHFLSGLATIGAATPVVRQLMANDNPSEKASPSFGARVAGATQDADASKSNREGREAKAAAEETKLSQSQARVASLSGDDTIRGMLDEETQVLYDKVTEGKDKKLKQEDYTKIENGIKKAEERFLENDDYDTYLKVAKVRQESMKADPLTAKKDLQKMDVKLKVAETLKGNAVPYEVYQLYAGSGGGDSDSELKPGISVSEMKKLLDDESEYYNPELANQLLRLDEMLANAGVSDNGLSGKKPKYSDIFDAIGGKGKGRSGGGGSPKIITNVGSVSGSSQPQGSQLKYRDINQWDVPIPNLSKQASKTNFKKNISVKRGVAL